MTDCTIHLQTDDDKKFHRRLEVAIVAPLRDRAQRPIEPVVNSVFTVDSE